MGSKDYKMLAAAIVNAHLSTAAQRRLTRELSSILKIDNPRFNEAKFRAFLAQLVERSMQQ